MVSVPLPQQPLRTPATPGLSAPGVAAPLDPRGVQINRLGQTLTRSSLAVARRAGELEERLHVAAVKEAQALAEEFSATASRGYLNTIGKDATGDGRERAWEALQEKIRGVEQGLDHEVQRDLFRQVSSSMMVGVGARWGQHEDRQVRAYEMGAGKAALESKKETARRLLPGDDPDGIEAGKPGSASYSLRTVKAEATSLARKQGLSPEQTRNFVRGHLTEVHAGRVEDMADAGRASEAGKYLTKVEKDVEAGVLNRLRDMVRNGSVGEEAAALALQIEHDIVRPPEAVQMIDDMRAFRASAGLEDLDPIAPPPRPTSTQLIVEGSRRALAMHDKGEISIDVRDKLLRELDVRSKILSNEEAQSAVRVLIQGQQWLRENAPNGVDQMPPSMQSDAAAAGVLGELRDFAGGKGRVSDPLVWAQAEALSDQVLADLSEAEVAREFSALSPQHLSEVFARWRRARGVATAEDNSILGEKERLRLALMENGMWPWVGAGSIEQTQDRWRMAEELQKRINDEKAADRPTKGEALQAIIDKLFLDVSKVPGGLAPSLPVIGGVLGAVFGGGEITAPTSSLTADEMLEALRVSGGALIPTIPPRKRAEIEATLRAKDLPVTPENIVEFFREEERVLRQRALQGPR